MLSFWTVFCLIAMGALIVGCGDDDPTSSTTAATAPELPPISTMVMDFADFTATHCVGRSENPEMALVGTNWLFAATSAGIWNLILTSELVIPVAAFAESFQHEAILQPDGWWHWSYNFGTGGVVYTAVLQGRITTTEIEWQMVVSGGTFTNWVWFTGSTDLIGSEGSWTISNAVGEPGNAMEIVWHRTSLLGLADIRYTNVIPQSADSGSYIHYVSLANSGGDPYDRFYEVYDRVNGRLTDINWSFTSKAGQVRDSVHFETTDWQCWDEMTNGLNDVACPIF